LPFQVRRRRWACLLRLCRRRVRRGRRSLLTDGLAIVVPDHHDDELGFLGSDDLARQLRPFDIAALIVADETGRGAMFAHDADLGLLGKGIFKPVGKPVGVGIAHHHDLDRGILARRGWRSVGVILGLFLLDFFGPFPPLFPPARGGGAFSLTITPVAPGDHPRNSHRDCTAAVHKDGTSAAHKDCTAVAIAAGAHPMNFPRTAHWLEAKQQSSAEPLLPLGQGDAKTTPCPMPLDLSSGRGTPTSLYVCRR